MADVLKIGDRVSSKFGPACVVEIELVSSIGVKSDDGPTQKVPFLAWDLVGGGWAIIHLDNGHWCYGFQVEPLGNSLEYRPQSAQERSAIDAANQFLASLGPNNSLFKRFQLTAHVCAWCPSSNALTAFYRAIGRLVSHGICAECQTAVLEIGAELKDDAVKRGLLSWSTVTR